MKLPDHSANRHGAARGSSAASESRLSARAQRTALYAGTACLGSLSVAWVPTNEFLETL